MFDFDEYNVNLTPKELKKLLKEKKRQRNAKKKKFNLFKYFSVKEMIAEFHGYGFEFSWKSYLLTLLIYMLCVLGVCLFCRLYKIYTIIIVVLLLIFLPLIIRSQFRIKYQLIRYEMVTNYLQNILSIFAVKPVINYALFEVISLLDGKMKEVVEKASNYVMSNNDDIDVFENAFAMIEDEFPNSRIYATHHLMLSVAKENSTNFESSIDNLRDDIQQWITRTYQQQKKMTSRKSQLILFTVLTIIMCCYFTIIFTSSEIMGGYVDVPLYQIGTFLFIIGCCILMLLFYTLINLDWMVNDRTLKHEESYLIAFQEGVIYPVKKAEVADIIIAIIFLALGGAGYWYFKNIWFIVGGIALFFYAIFSNKLTYSSNMRKVKKAIQMEFPIWLRDICLNLNNYTVLNSIEKSEETSSVIMRYYIRKFLKEALEDPTSIEPYNDFLAEFKLNDVRADMKVLYALQNHSNQQVEKQINSLIVRNQNMIATSEEIRHENNVSSMLGYGFAPVLLFVFDMMMNMVVILSYLMMLIGTSLTI